MEITKETLLKDILIEYPWMEEDLKKRVPIIKPLFSPLGRSLRENGTIEDISRKVGKTPERLIEKLNGIIEEHYNG